ncbi:hypothetical protein CPL00151_CDS0055 [Escherichia phage Delraymugoa]
MHQNARPFLETKTIILLVLYHGKKHVTLNSG